MTWRGVVGFENYYAVSNTGLIWSYRRNKTLTPKIDKYGYKAVSLFVNGVPYYRTVHRLVAEAFIPNPLNLSTVNHINEIKTDNEVTNLEWASIKDNDNHGTRNQRMADSKCHKPVEQLLSDGTTIVYKGVKDAARKTGVHRCSIANCCKGIFKMAGGYKWRYYNESN